MTRFRHVVAAFALCLAVGAAPRPQQPAAVAQVAAVAPISLSDADGQDLVLEDLSARTAIQGMLSLTELDLRFRNPKARRIEGRFSCTLPSNAAISRFAKEVNGQLMEGEVVERLRANQVYEQFLHQMRDPALLEQDQGNRFSARIFPIEANAPVRILISYTTLLPLRDGVRTFTLPLRGIDKVHKLTFRATVSAMPGESGSEGLSHSSNDVWTLNETDTTPEHDIDLKFTPLPNAPRERILRAGDFYLAALRPQLTSRSTPPPHDWSFYVDTSASSAEGSIHRIRALEMLFASLPSDDNVQLIAFDQEVTTLGSGSASEMSRETERLLR